jgi:hypothetical protein
MRSRSSPWQVVFLALTTVVGTASAPFFAHGQDLIESCARDAETSQEHRDAGRLIQARERLRSCAREACPRAVRQDCRTWLAEVEGILPSLVLLANDDQGRALHDVSLQVDGKVIAKVLDGKPVFLDPGVHRLMLTSAGHDAWEQDIVVRTGEKNRSLMAVLRRTGASKSDGTGDSEGTTVPAISWLLLGVGAAALGTGAYLGLDARADVADMRDTCAPGCPSSDVDDARRQLLFADVALGTGLVAVGAATWFWVKGKPETPDQVRIEVLPGGWAAAYAGDF